MAEWMMIDQYGDATMPSESTITEAKRRWRGFWRRNSSIVLMVLAQLISSFIAVAAKLLQTSSEDYGALDTRQVLITMMSVTMALSWLWMFLTGVPGAPFGTKNVWALLTLRGIAGVFGIWGFYYSLRYLPLSEATVINFLSPIVAAFASSLISRVPFTITQQVASAISILGVILISQPWQMLAETSPEIPPVMPQVTNGSFTFCRDCHGTFTPHAPENSPSVPVTSLQRIAAVGAALVGVAGGAAAYVAMSLIGQSAHPAVTVHHFAVWTVLMSAIGFAITGLEACRMPSASEWGLLMFLGVFGLLLQLLIATSLQGGGGSTKALNMVYMQIVFALVMDEVVWGQRPNWVSGVGGVVILGSVVVAAMSKGKRGDEGGSRRGLREEVYDEEEVEMMVGKEEGCSSDDEQ